MFALCSCSQDHLCVPADCHGTPCGSPCDPAECPHYFKQCCYANGHVDLTAFICCACF